MFFSVYDILMNQEDIDMIKEICGDAIQTGHLAKLMGENEAFHEIFDIKNSRDFALGNITGTIIQRFHTYWVNKYGKQMDQDDVNFLGSILGEFAETIKDSLFK